MSTKTSTPTLGETDNQLLCGSIANVMVIEFQHRPRIQCSTLSVNPDCCNRQSNTSSLSCRKTARPQGRMSARPNDQPVMIGLVLHNFSL